MKSDTPTAPSLPAIAPDSVAIDDGQRGGSKGLLNRLRRPPAAAGVFVQALGDTAVVAAAILDAANRRSLCTSCT